MPDTKISAMTVATALADGDVLPIVQGGTNKKADVSLLGGRAGMLVAASGASATIKARADYVCDATADNVEIQAAIDAMGYGGEVYLSPGLFNIAAGINVWDGTALLGSGSAEYATRLYAVNGLNGNVITCRDHNTTDDWWHCGKLGNFLIKGNSANQTSGNGVMVYRLGENSVIDCIQVKDAKQDGIKITGESASGAHIRNLSFMGCLQYGLNLDDCRRTMHIVGLSGDDNGSLLRVYGMASLSLVVEGIKSEATIAGRHEPAILLEGIANQEYSFALIGGTITAEIGPGGTIGAIHIADNCRITLAIHNTFIYDYTYAIVDFEDPESIARTTVDRIPYYSRKNWAP